jgi:hypothetical protein
MFPSSNPTWSAVLRMLVGPAMPRTVDTSVLHSSTASERAGR